MSVVSNKKQRGKMQELGTQTDRPEKSRFFFRRSNFSGLNFYESKNMFKKIVICLSFSLMFYFAHGANLIKNPVFDAGEKYISPYRSGTAIAIDGDIYEWRPWPGSINYSSGEQVVFGKNKWKDTKDLSGIVWTAWDENFFYLAADIKDDVVVQTMKGPDMWRGDHIEIYIDTTYKKGQGKGAFGKGQFQLGISPGNLKNAKDPFENVPCEAQIWFPNENISPSSICVASMKTSAGYTIEAAIPWTMLGITPAKGTSIGLDICLSDTDNALEGQKSMMSMLTSAWDSRDKGRLVEMILGNAEGEIANIDKPKSDTSISKNETSATKNGGSLIMGPKTLEIFEQKQVFKDRDTVVEFDAKDLPSGFECVLSFMARIEFHAIGGGTQVLKLSLNDENIAADKLVNRNALFTMPNFKGSNPVPAYNDNKGYFLFYSPSFDNVPPNHTFYVPELADASHTFEFNITGILKKGENILIFKNGSNLGSRSKITGTFYWCLGGTFGFAPLRQPQNFFPIPSV